MLLHRYDPSAELARPQQSHKETQNVDKETVFQAQGVEMRAPVLSINLLLPGPAVELPRVADPEQTGDPQLRRAQRQRNPPPLVGKRISLTMDDGIAYSAVAVHYDSTRGRTGQYCLRWDYPGTRDSARER